MMRRTAVCATLGALLWMSFVLLSGCEESYRTRALFTKPELYTYERHAVLGLDLEQEQIFMAAYVKTFSGRIITFVERNRLASILGEQDLLKGRLNDRTRAKLQEVLGVDPSMKRPARRSCASASWIVRPGPSSAPS